MSDSPINEGGQRRRRRFAPLVWGGSVLAALLLVLGVSGTLSSWTEAVVNNQGNQAGSAQPLILQETGPDATGTSTTCTSTDNADNSNADTCTTINKYGDAGAASLSMSPGDSHSTSVTLTNTGATDAATFSLAPGTCASAYQAPLSGTPATGLCDALQVAISCTGGATLTVPATDLSALSTEQLGGLAQGAAATCVFTTSLPAGTSATYGGQTATQDLTWTISNP